MPNTVLENSRKLIAISISCFVFTMMSSRATAATSCDIFNWSDKLASGDKVELVSNSQSAMEYAEMGGLMIQNRKFILDKVKRKGQTLELQVAAYTEKDFKWTVFHNKKPNSNGMYTYFSTNLLVAMVIIVDKKCTLTIRYASKGPVARSDGEKLQTVAPVFFSQITDSHKVVKGKEGITLGAPAYLFYGENVTLDKKGTPTSGIYFADSLTSLKPETKKIFSGHLYLRKTN